MKNDWVGHCQEAYTCRRSDCGCQCPDCEAAKAKARPTPAVPPEMPEELVESAWKVVFKQFVGKLDYQTRMKLLEDLRAAVSLAFRAGMERERTANASARACAEWLSTVAGVLPRRSREEGEGAMRSVVAESSNDSMWVAPWAPDAP